MDYRPDARTCSLSMMTKRRKTADERRYEADEAAKRAYEEFRSQAADVRTLADARILVSHARNSDPGRRYYSNLGFFLNTFAPPDGASLDELSLYLAMVRHFDASGDVKSGALVEIEAALQAAKSRR